MVGWNRSNSEGSICNSFAVANAVKHTETGKGVPLIAVRGRGASTKWSVGVEVYGGPFNGFLKRVEMFWNRIWRAARKQN